MYLYNHKHVFFIQTRYLANIFKLRNTKDYLCLFNLSLVKYQIILRNVVGVYIYFMHFTLAKIVICKIFKWF